MTITLHTWMIPLFIEAIGVVVFSVDCWNQDTPIRGAITLLVCTCVAAALSLGMLIG
jgi:hypothetical protein